MLALPVNYGPSEESERKERWLELGKTPPGQVQVQGCRVHGTEPRVIFAGPVLHADLTNSICIKASYFFSSNNMFIAKSKSN